MKVSARVHAAGAPSLPWRANEGALRRFFFYGILQDGGRVHHGLDLIPLGPAAMRGDLYSVGGYFPALRDGPGVVQGHLWEAPDALSFAAALDLFDRIESYVPGDPDSMYRRELRELLSPEDQVAYVYVWNHDWRRLEPIPSGRWR